MRRWRFWLLIALVIACACLPFITQNDYQVRILFRIAIFAALGLAWNLVGGFAGQLSLGHAAFFGLGAYGLAIFTAHGVPMWISLLLAALVATLFAAAIGRIAFRLRGPYFTLATIAFAEVLRLTATNLEITGGAIGLDVPTLFTGRSFIRMMYFAAVILALITFLINFATSRSRPGYYLMAIREDEDTASAVGVDTANYKLRALLVSAFITALGGALYASSSQHVVPDDAFAMEISVQIAIIAMLGGAGTLAGPIAGAVLLLTASEVFKNQFREGHLLIYGVLIVLVVLFLPDGIVGGLQRLWRRRNPPPATGALPGSPDAQQEAGA